MSATNATDSSAERTVREAVGVFHNVRSLESTVDELMRSGFDRAEISLLAGQDVVEAKLGHVYDKVSELEDDPQVPRTAYVGRDSIVEGRASVIGGLAYVGAMAAVGAVVASGGTIAMAAVAAALAGGSGGVLGSLIARSVGHDHAERVQQQLDKGGLLLWVRVRDEDHERQARVILARHSADDVHVHEIPVDGDPANNPFVGVNPDPFLGARI